MQTATPLNHLAIIMDGNGRWAEQHNLPRLVGHGAGGITLSNLLIDMLASPTPIPLLTAYVFSSENWKRPDSEIASLFKQLTMIFILLQTDPRYRGVRMRFIGDITSLPSPLRETVENIQQDVRPNTRITLNIAINYSGRWDILNTCRKMAEEVNAGRLSSADITEDNLNRHLALGNIPEPDLLIRTGGEKRISNFLLWQMAYTELYFEDCLWPDFTKHHLNKALLWYNRRQRRFGTLGEASDDSANVESNDYRIDPDSLNSSSEHTAAHDDDNSRTEY